MGNKFKMWLFLLILHCFLLDYAFNLPLNQTDLIDNEDLKTLNKSVINNSINNITENKTADILLTTTTTTTTVAETTPSTTPTAFEKFNNDKNEDDIIINSNSRNLELDNDSEKQIKPNLGNEAEGNLIEYRESESKSDDMDAEIRNALNIEKETAIESAASEALDDIPDPEVRKTFRDELLDINYPKNIRQEDSDKKEPETESLNGLPVKPEVDEGTLNPNHVKNKELSVESSTISNKDKRDNLTTVIPILSHKIEEDKIGNHHPDQENDKDDTSTSIGITTIIPQTEINSRDGKSFKNLNEEESDEVPYEFPIKSRRKIYTENHSADTDFASKLNESNFGKSFQINENMLTDDNIQAEKLIDQHTDFDQHTDLPEMDNGSYVNVLKKSEDLEVEFTTLASHSEIPEEVFEELQPGNEIKENQTEKSNIDSEVIQELNNTVVDQQNSDIKIETNETNETENKSILEQRINDFDKNARKSDNLEKEIANKTIMGKSFLNEDIIEDENRGVEDDSDVNDSAIEISTEISLNDTNLSILNREEEMLTERSDEDDTTMSSDTKTVTTSVIVNTNNDFSTVKYVLASDDVTTDSPLYQIEAKTLDLSSQNEHPKKVIDSKEILNRKFGTKKEEFEEESFERKFGPKKIKQDEITTITEENNINSFETFTSTPITDSVNYKIEKIEKIKKTLNDDNGSSSSSEEDNDEKIKKKKDEKQENKNLKNKNNKLEKKNKDKNKNDSSEENKGEKNDEKLKAKKVLKVYDLLNEANYIKKRDFDNIIPLESAKSISLESIVNNNQKAEISLEDKTLNVNEFDETSMPPSPSFKVLIPSSKEEKTNLPLLTFETTTVLPRKVFRQAMKFHENDKQILEESEIPVDADILNEIISEDSRSNIGRALPNQGVPKESNVNNSAITYLLLSTAIVLIIGILIGTFYKYRGRQGTLNIELEERVNGKNDNIDDLQEVSISPSDSELSQTNSLLPPSDGTENTSTNATTSLLSGSQNLSNDISHNDNSSDLFIK